MDRIIINELIDKIEVSEDNNGELSVYIDFKHKNPFIEDIAMYEHYTTVGWHNIGTEFIKFMYQEHSNIASELMAMAG